MKVTTVNAINDINRYGYINCQDSVFATARGSSTGNGVGIDTSESGCAAYLSGGSYFLRRSFLSYDLGASIPTQAAVESVTVNFFVQTANFFDDDATSVFIVSGSQSNPIVLGDFDALTFSSLGSKAMSSISTNAYNSWTLSAAGILLVQSAIKSAGVLNLCHLMGPDYNNVAPVGVNQIGITNPAGGNPPYLSVTYRLPIGGFVF